MLSKQLFINSQAQNAIFTITRILQMSAPDEISYQWPSKFVIGALYKVKKNVSLFLRDPNSYLLNKELDKFIEPTEIDLDLRDGEIFLYVGEAIGPNDSGVYLHKILFKDGLYYAVLYRNDVKKL
jgi:hypothetical protein